MPAYTVAQVSSTVGDWNHAQGGAMKSYRIDLTDSTGQVLQNVEWSRKVTSPPPAVGQTLDGTVSEGNYGPKFKQTPSAGFGGAPKGRSPEENARIIRQHSQEMGLRYATIRGKSDFSLDDLRTIIDWFDADAKAAKP